MSDARDSSEARVEGVPTPFYDLLTAMIEAHALEKERVRQHDNATGQDDMVLVRKANGDTGRSLGSDVRDLMQDLRRVKVNSFPLVANHKWSVLTQHLNSSIAALIVTAAIGVIFVLQVNVRQPPLVAAANDSSKGSPPIIGPAGATNEAVERPLQASEPGGLGKLGVEAERAIVSGIRTSNMVAAHSDDRTVAPPIAAQSIENLASDPENGRQVGGGLEVRSSGEVAHSNTIDHATNAPSKQSLPQAASSPQPVAGETGSAIDRSNETVAMRIARAISHVNMRSGPSNDQAVIMTIPEGSPVEVVRCHHWCELIFAGQRGWVYKSLIDMTPMPRRL